MKNNMQISQKIMEQIQLCDCSYIRDGVDLFLNDLKNVKYCKDIPVHYIIPAFEKSSKQIIGNIYHYTNAKALSNILNSGGGKSLFTLRLSRVDYMNDIYDGKDIFEFVFNGCINNDNIDISNNFRQYVIGLVNSLQNGQFNNSSSREISYLTSLSIDGDSLPMWRNYTSNGGGYNIILNPNILWGYCAKNHNMALIPVVYEYDLMVSIINSLLTAFSYVWENDLEERRHIGILMLRQMLLSKLSFKHPSFSHEQEIRLINFGQRVVGINENEKYTVVNGIMRPYIDVEIPKEVLMGVTVGPLLEADAAKRTVENIIMANGGWGSSNVDISVAPIRF